MSELGILTFMSLLMFPSPQLDFASGVRTYSRRSAHSAGPFSEHRANPRFWAAQLISSLLSSSRTPRICTYTLHRRCLWEVLGGFEGDRERSWGDKGKGSGV